MFNYLYQLPQNLLGLLVIFFSKAKEKNGIYYTTYRFGVSLGKYIIVYKYCNDTSIQHEKGHQVQSKRLGWLYLIVIGLPSAIRNLYDRKFHKNWSYTRREIWYYSHFPEKQADKYGGVRRNW